MTAVAGGWTPVAPPVRRRRVDSPPWFHAIDGDPSLVWLVDASQLFAVNPDFVARLRAEDPSALDAVRAAAAAGAPPPDVPASLGAPRAVSLALAQACNLSCSYCYADEGRFGGPARRMSSDVARRAVDNLLDGADGQPVTLGFLGGEVLLHRQLLHEIVRYAAGQAEVRGVSVRFSITTNGTLVSPADIDLFRDHRFTVTVSLDGGRTANDRHRRKRTGSCFAAAVDALAPLLVDPGPSKVVARATVARDDLRVHERIEELAGVGFVEVGVSPLRTGPDVDLRFRPEDWAPFLDEMVRAAAADIARVRNGGLRARFSNLTTALREIHRGSARSLPCGSAASYVAVGADGAYWTCHRTVDDPRYELGNLVDGLSDEGRAKFVQSRRVDNQEPCRSCWARYLCGGGCHAEVGEVGRAGCDYIRGWLEHCISVYAACAAEGPHLLSAMGVIP